MNIFNKFNLQKSVFNIYINWAAILAFVAFWSYGFFGALTAKSFGLAANILISFVLCVIFILFLRIWENDSLYRDKIIIKNKDILVFVSFFVIMLILSFNNLTMPIGGDQLTHSQQSKLHSITLIDFLSNKTDFFNNFSFKYLIYIIDLFIIVAGFFIYKFIKNKNWLFKVIIFSSLFLVFRFAIMAFGGSAGSHPSFRLFPLWLSSALFTSTDLSFRLAQFIGLIGLMWLIQRITNKKLNFINSWLFALSIGTIPVLWHVGILAEQSIWTAIAWTIFLLYFFGDNNDIERKEINYIRWISIISIFTMLRQSAFVALAPIFLILVVNSFKKREFNFKNILILINPVLVILPFLLHSVIVGNPAVYLGELSSFQRVWGALSSGIIFNATINSVSWPWIIFLFIPLLFFIKNPSKILTILVFFVAGVYIFYMVVPGVWGIGRYQAEYIVPFATFGFFLFINFIVGRYDFARRFLPALFIFLIISNIYVFKNLAKFNKSIDELKISFNEDIKIRGKYAILSEFPYEYRQAFAAAKKDGYAGKIFVAGVTYGVFVEILNNFTVSEIKAEKSIYKEIQLNISAENINKNNKIQLVLISDFAGGDKLKNDLENLGWEEWKEFRNDKYKSVILVLNRKK